MHSKTIFKELTVEMYAKSMYAYRNDTLLFWYISRKKYVTKTESKITIKQIQ